MQPIAGCSKRPRREAREKSTSGGVFIHPLERGDRAQRSKFAFVNSLRLLTILYFFAATTFAASNPFDDARAAYDRGDYVQAMRLFRQLADKGHQWAQRRVGSMYAEGKGVAQDYQEALKWYRLAAAQRNTPAQYSLGMAYEKGQGVPQDYQEAIKWYRIA